MATAATSQAASARTKWGQKVGRKCVVASLIAALAVLFIGYTYGTDLIGEKRSKDIKVCSNSLAKRALETQSAS